MSTPAMTPQTRPAVARWLLLALLLAVASAAFADGEQMHEANGYRIHYSAVPTMVIGESIARRYGITRSPGHGLLTVTVLRVDTDSGEEHPVRARIQAISQSLLGQRQDFNLRETGVDDSVSYVGEFRIRGEETLRFELTVLPESQRRAIPVKFQQHLVGR